MLSNPGQFCIISYLDFVMTWGLISIKNIKKRNHNGGDTTVVCGRCYFRLIFVCELIMSYEINCRQSLQSTSK